MREDLPRSTPRLFVEKGDSLRCAFGEFGIISSTEAKKLIESADHASRPSFLTHAEGIKD